MGIWQEFCLCCGAPIENELVNSQDEEVVQLLKEEKIKKTDFNWLSNLILITSMNRVIKVKGNGYNGSGEIEIGKDLYCITPLNWHEDFQHIGYGLICHKDCYDLLDIKLGYKLKFSDLCRLVGPNTCTLKQKGKYGKMKKYSFGQFFDYFSCLSKDLWLLQSPRKNKDNMNRILNAWEPLVKRFKNNKNTRRSPCESATIFKVGTVLPGSDGTEWIVKSSNGIKRWIPYEI